MALSTAQSNTFTSLISQSAQLCGQHGNILHRVVQRKQLCAGFTGVQLYALVQEVVLPGRASLFPVPRSSP